MPVRPLCTDLNELLELLVTLDINEERLELEGWPLAKFRSAAAAASAARLVEERPFWCDISSTPLFVFPPLIDVGLLGGSIIASLSLREATSSLFLLHSQWHWFRGRAHSLGL